MICGVCDLGVSEDFIIEVRTKSLTYDFPMVRVCGPTCLKEYWKDYIREKWEFTYTMESDAPSQG